MHPHALLQRLTQCDGPAVLLQEIAKSVFGKILQLHALLEGKPIEGVPRLSIKLDPAANGFHGSKNSFEIAANSQTIGAHATAGLSPCRCA
jgi:hypothetical protein